LGVCGSFGKWVPVGGSKYLGGTFEGYTGSPVPFPLSASCLPESGESSCSTASSCCHDIFPKMNGTNGPSTETPETVNQNKKLLPEK
jgi:hypothetical protein